MQEYLEQHCTSAKEKAKPRMLNVELPGHWPWLSLPLSLGVDGRDGADADEVEGGEGGEGLASSSSTSSLTFVAWPPLVDIIKVADLPDFLKDWNMSIKEDNSSTIFSTESELK